MGFKETLDGALEGALDVIVRIVSFIVLGVLKLVGKVVELILRALQKVNNRFVKFSIGLRNRVGERFPISSKNWITQMVVYSGLSKNPEEILGVLVIYGCALSGIVSLFVFVMRVPEQFGISAGLALLTAIAVPFVLVWILIYMVFIMLIERRTAAIEKVLPDVLTMISQNMIAGMTIYNSLWVAARPEFGPFAWEIQTVARETLSGEAFERALLNMSDRIKSYKLARAVKLITQGMRSGGELPTVLQEISNDIRAEQNLIRRMSSETSSQAMFILFALLVGAPLLFGASMQFINIFDMIYSEVGISDNDASMMQGGMVSLQRLPITPAGFKTYAMVTLAVSGLFGALLVGLIRSGKLSNGIPLIPVISSAAILIFLGIDEGLAGLFSQMMI